MQNAASWILFLLFAVVQVGMYVGIRRHALSPILIAAAGVLASVVLMAVVGLLESGVFAQAVFVGFTVGGLFSVAVLAVAFYFQRSEARRRM